MPSQEDDEYQQTPIEQCAQLLSTPNNIISPFADVLKIITDESQRVAYIKKMKPNSDSQYVRQILKLWNLSIPCTIKKKHEDVKKYELKTELDELRAEEYFKIDLELLEHKHGILSHNLPYVPKPIGYGWTSSKTCYRYADGEGTVHNITSLTLTPKREGLSDECVLVGLMYFFIDKIN